VQSLPVASGSRAAHLPNLDIPLRLFVSQCSKMNYNKIIDNIKSAADSVIYLAGKSDNNGFCPILVHVLCFLKKV
jgi:hypothetical protein